VITATTVRDLTPAELERIRNQAKKSLYFFVKGVLGKDWIDKDIHLPICKILEDFANRRVGVVLPRSWLKSTLVTIAYPLWRSINNPDYRCLIVQNTYDNATKKLSEIKTIVEKNELFRALFPEILPDESSSWRADSACLKRPGTFPESTFEVAGTKTRVTSRHYDDIIEDDTVAPDLDDLGIDSIAPSKDQIDQAIGWHRLAVPLLAPIGCAIVG
jgi:hypothetical protein